MRSLSSLLVARQVASARQVDGALARQALYGGDLVTNVLELLGPSGEAALTRTAADYYGYTPAPEGELPVAPPEVRRLFAAETAAKLGLYPLGWSDDGRLEVAVAEPLREPIADDLGFALGAKLRQSVAPLVRVRQALARDYGHPLDRRLLRLLAGLRGESDPSPSSLPPPNVRRAVVENAASARRPEGEAASVRRPEGEAAATSASPERLRALSAALRTPTTARPASNAPMPASARSLVDWMRRASSEARFERAKRRRGPLTPASAEAELHDGETAEAVLHVLFEFARQYFTTTVVFVVRGTSACGLEGAGPGVDEARVRSLEVTLEAPGVLAAARDQGTALVTRLGAGERDAAIGVAIGRGAATPVLVVPLAVRERCVALLYVDDAGGELELNEAGEVLGIAPLVSAALERLARRRKSKAAPSPAGVAMPSRKPTLMGLRPFAEEATQEAITPRRPAADADAGVGGREVEVEARAEDDRSAAHESASRGETAWGESRSAAASETSPPDTNAPAEITPRVGAERPSTAAPSLPGGPGASDDRSTSDWLNDLRPRARMGAPDASSTPSVGTRAPFAGAGATPAWASVVDPEDGRATPVIGPPRAAFDRGVGDRVTPVRPMIDPRPTPSSPGENLEDAPTVVYGPDDDVNAAFFGNASARGEGDAAREAVTEAGANAVAAVATANETSSYRAPFRPPSARHVAALPTVIVDEGYAAVLDRLLAGGEGAGAALDEIVRVGGRAVPTLLATLPGPTTYTNDDLLAGRVRPAEAGPVFAALVAMGRAALPFVTAQSGAAAAGPRFYATYLLGGFPFDESGVALAPRLFDANDDVRHVAFVAVQQLGVARGPGRAVVRTLEGTVLNTGAAPERRMTAAEGLADLRHGPSAGVLIDALSDGGPTPVIAALRRALVTLTARDFGVSAVLWMAWWSDNARRPRERWLLDALDAEPVALRNRAALELAGLIGVPELGQFAEFDEAARREVIVAARRRLDEARPRG